MTRLTWGATGERFYEVGVDRGVLYVPGKAGVPWIGLVSVTESPISGEAKSSYIDGYKYSNRATNEDFEASIEAFTYPDEFAEVDGTSAIRNGLYATQQKRKSFSLCYRSKIGNDVDAEDHGYKIHIIYNALAAPATRVNTTIGSSVSPNNFSWKLSTRAPLLSGRKPTAHFLIDSRDTPRELLQQVEDILYGSATTNPRLPSIEELIFLFDSFSITVFDGGPVGEPYYSTFDGGIIPAAQTSRIEGGTP